VAVVVSYLGTTGSSVFTTLVLMTGITAAIPYAFSALAQILWRWRDKGTIATATFVRDLVVAVVALVFSIAFIYYSRNTGDTWYVVWGPFLLAGAAGILGIPVYLAQRGHMDSPTSAKVTM
jgi:APA family basic amino acid/polyamine antiporter